MVRLAHVQVEQVVDTCIGRLPVCNSSDALALIRFVEKDLHRSMYTQRRLIDHIDEHFTSARPVNDHVPIFTAITITFSFRSCPRN